MLHQGRNVIRRIWIRNRGRVLLGRRALYYNRGGTIRQIARLSAAGEKVEGECRDDVWKGWIPMALGTLVGLELLQGKDRFESRCNARNIQDFYKIVEKPIGAGGFGVVCTGTHKETGEVVAIKQLRKKAIKKEKVLEEINILRLVGDHQNIIGFKDLFVNEEYWFIVMEMAQGGELFDRLVQKGAYSESQASTIMKEIVEAVMYLHEQGIVHCDLKPENVLLASDKDDAGMRLVDFGSAFRVDSGKPVVRKGSGTIAYSAPEVLSGQVCDTKADMWSLGVIIFILLTGYHPFDPMNNSDDKEIARRIQQEDFVDFDTPVWQQISPDAKDLVQSLLSLDPKNRPTCQEILHHPWIAGEDLSQEPLEESAENLRRFHRGRRRLKALMLAVMAGFTNDERTKEDAEAVDKWRSSWDKKGTGEEGEGAKLKKKLSETLPAELLGSRRAAIRLMDPEQKGHVTAHDINRIIGQLGEDLGERDIQEILKSGSGDPNADAQAVSHQELIKLLPPLCPSKVFKRGQTIYKEGDQDSTFYLLQKGEALFRFSCQGFGKGEIPIEVIPMGSTFGEMEMLLTHDGTVMPRAGSVECISPRCELIAIEDYLFSLLTDVFSCVNGKLHEQAERRSRKLLEAWAKSVGGTKQSRWRKQETVWSADKREKHKFFMVIAGFIEVEYAVKDSNADQKLLKKVIKRYGPGTYLYTKGLEGSNETCLKVKSLTDSQLVEVPGKAFDDFLSVSHKEVMVKFIMENQEEKEKVVTVTTADDDTDDEGIHLDFPARSSSLARASVH